MSLKAIERVCKQEKSNKQSNKKAPNTGKKEKKRPGTESTARVPKEVRFKKHCNLCKKHGGVCTMHNTKDCRKYEKDSTEKLISLPPRKQKETQSCKELFCTIKQEDGQA
jgi:hypothetical protein